LAEQRQGAADEALQAAVEIDLPSGQRCIRVTYINGVRDVLDSDVTVLRRVSANTYEVRGGGGATELCHGYQLVPIPDAASDREGFEGPDPQAVVRTRAAQTARALRRLETGGLVSALYKGKVYIAELRQPYVAGGMVDLLYYAPLGGGRFQRPTTMDERDKAMWVTPLEDITKVGVALAADGSVPLEQFQGAVRL